MRDTESAARDDVIVVGAGPIGLVAALLMADRGLRVTVIEKMTAPGDLPRAISLQDESLRTFAQLGVADALKKESLLDTGSRYFGLGERLLLEAKPVPSRIGHPAKTQFDQPILEDLLFARAQSHERITFLTGTEVTAVAQDTERVVVTTGDDRHEASWLVGADGGKSLVRKQLGIGLVGTTQPQRWIVVDLVNETSRRDPFAEFHCDGRRPYVIVPGVDGRLRIEFMLFDHEDADAMTTPEAIRDLVVPTFRDELRPADVRRAVVYIAHQRIAATFRAGRAFLIGDAAHLMPPFAGQGLNAGVRDASNLAWKLVEAVRGGATDALLDTYETERRAHGAAMVTVSRRIGRVVMATGRIVPRLRDLAVRAISRVPSAREHLANMRFITPPDYSRGAAVAGGPACPHLAVGRALPQPIVQTPDGDELLLDELLGDGWAVITIGGASPDAPDDYWRRLGARFIAVRRTGSAATRAGEVTELAPQLVPHGFSGRAHIVVRPDRYVAAVYGDDEERVVSGLREFIDVEVRRHDSAAAPRA